MVDGFLIMLLFYVCTYVNTQVMIIKEINIAVSKYVYDTYIKQ